MDFWISDWISGFHSGFLDFCSLVPRPSITANEVEGLVKLLRRMTSGGRKGGRKGGRRTFGGVVLSV